MIPTPLSPDITGMPLSLNCRNLNSTVSPPLSLHATFLNALGTDGNAGNGERFNAGIDLRTRKNDFCAWGFDAQDRRS